MARLVEKGPVVIGKEGVVRANRVDVAYVEEPGSRLEDRCPEIGKGRLHACLPTCQHRGFRIGSGDRFERKAKHRQVVG
jgi:hypothetical protein